MHIPWAIGCTSEKVFFIEGSSDPDVIVQQTPCEVNAACPMPLPLEIASESKGRIWRSLRKTTGAGQFFHVPRGYVVCVLSVGI